MHEKAAVTTCSVGKACGETCSSLSNGNDRDFQHIQELDTVVKEESVLRLGIELEGNPTILPKAQREVHSQLL